MKKAVLTCVCMLIAVVAMAQRQQQISVDLLSTANPIGINYERPFSKNSQFAWRAGFSFNYAKSSGLLFDANSLRGYQLPLEINYLTKGKRNHLELGAGVLTGIYNLHLTENYWTWIEELGYAVITDSRKYSKNEFGYNCFVNIAWRHEFNKGFTMRLGVSPTFGFGDKHRVYNNRVSLLIGVGYRF